MPDLIQNQQQLNHVVNNLDGVNLFVFALGSAHLSDTQQQCPNFCLETAGQGQKVVIVNIDTNYSHAKEGLIPENIYENIICHYGTLSYVHSYSENFYNLPSDKLIFPNDLKEMHKQLLENQQLKIVYLYQKTNMIDEHFTHEKRFETTLCVSSARTGLN